MPAPPAPGIITLDAIWTQANEPVENTYHYRFGGTIDIALLNAIAETYEDWVQANQFLFSSDCAWIKAYVADLTSTSSASVEYNPGAPIDGTDPGAALPNNVTWALKRLTAKKGRANRGRIYWIGMTAADLDPSSQQITAARATLRVTAGLALMAAQLTDNGVQEVVYHKAAGTGTDVVSYGYSDLFLDSQRRRLPGHNRHH